jgi:antitoxin component YwqK of YwqJK toxin-antitoxin module
MITYLDGKQNGKVLYLYLNGKAKVFGHTHDNLMVGWWEFYLVNGNLEKRLYYREGLKNGLIEEYYKNGNIEARGYYVQDELSGQWELFDSLENGKHFVFMNYDNDSLLGVERKQILTR